MIMKHESTMTEAITRLCQFTVRGTEQAGVIYVTGRGTDESSVIAQATAVAAKRSGDPAPVFVRFA
jgi:hypothetical protein